MDEYHTWRSYMNKRMNYLKQAPAESPETFVEQALELHNMKSELLSQEENSIESEAALILEYGLD